MVLAFYMLYKPSKSKFNNYVNILIELSYIGLEVTILLYANSVNLSTEEKLQYGTAMLGLSLCALFLSIIWMLWQFLLFMYDFKFIRDIVEETKLANNIHPDDDNLKIDFEKEYEKDEIVSEQEMVSMESHTSHKFSDDAVEGIEKAYAKENGGNMRR